jgi:3-oxoacyl-[acyl-carrier-protein] synthase III
MRIVSTSSNGGSQENAFYSNTNRSRGRGGKTSFRGQPRSSHGGHHQHEVKLMEVDEETLEEEEVEEVVEVVVEIIEVNN